jgi:gluconate kinase
MISEQQDQARVSARKGHFFGEPLLASQYAALELPEPDESRVYPVQIGTKSPGQLAADIITMLGLNRS